MRHGTSTLARTLLAAGLAVALTPLAAATSYAGPSQEGPIKVVGNAQNEFDPVDVTATPDAKGEITIEFVSEGAPHTWENKSLGIDSGIVNAGDTKTFSFKAPPEGKHKIICVLHESVGMIGSLTVTAAGGEENPDASPTARPASEPPASASASASVGAPADGDDAPLQGEHEDEGEEGAHAVPGVEGNETLERIEAQRAAEAGAVSGFKFFTFVAVAFLFILGAAVLFSTRPRRAGR